MIRCRYPLFSSLAAAAIASALLAGCASSRNLQAQPQAQLTPEALPAQQVLARSALPIQHAWPQQDWWLGWHDAQLNQLIQAGLTSSPTLAQALARVHAAEAQAGIARADRGPTLGAVIGYSGVRLPQAIIPVSAGGGELDYRSDLLVQFKWDVDLWGGKRAAWEAAVGEAQATAVDAQAARIALSTAIARTYAQLAAAWLQHDVANADVQRTGQLNTLQAQRVKEGLDNQISLQQTRAEAAAALQRQQQAMQQIAHLRLALAQLSAQGPDAALLLQRPTLTPDSLHFAEVIPDNASIGLLAHRADIQAARLRVQAAQQHIANARTQFLPNISIGALAGALGDQHFDLFSLSHVFYQFGPTVTLPIFESGKLRANLEGQNARYEAAVAQYNQTLLDATHQVADAVTNARTLREQIAQQQSSVDAAQKGWNLMQQRYGKGLANRLQVLQIQQQLLGAQQRLAQLQAQRMDNAISLTYALGGGYVTGATQQTPRP